MGGVYPVAIPLPEEEDQLLRRFPRSPDSPHIQTFDVDRSLRPDVSGCSVSKPKVVSRVSPGSSTVVGSEPRKPSSPVRDSPGRSTVVGVEPRRILMSPIRFPDEPAVRPKVPKPVGDSAGSRTQQNSFSHASRSTVRPRCPEGIAADHRPRKPRSRDTHRRNSPVKAVKRQASPDRRETVKLLPV